MILPSVPFEMVMGSNAFFMFFNYKYKNTKLIFFLLSIFSLVALFFKIVPRDFPWKKMGGKGKEPGVEVDSFFKLYPSNPDLLHSDHHLVSVLVTDVKFSKNSL